MSTPEERAELRDKFSGVVAANMGVSFAMAAAEEDGLTIDVALRGCVAMFEFGLVLAERAPEMADKLRLAAREDDVAKNAPITIDQAVDAVIEYFS